MGIERGGVQDSSLIGDIFMKEHITMMYYKVNNCQK